jgi:hypothetical protein
MDKVLQELKDKIEINEAVHKYYYYIDHKMLDETLDLFLDDSIADFDVLGKLEGKAAMKGFFPDYFAGNTIFKFAFHMVHNGFVEVDGDTAKGYWQIEKANTIDGIGATWTFTTNRNIFERTGNVWKIKELREEVHALTPYREGWDRVGLIVPGFPRA